MQVSQGKGDSGTDHIGRGKTLLAGTGAGGGGVGREVVDFQRSGFLMNNLRDQGLRDQWVSWVWSFSAIQFGVNSSVLFFFHFPIIFLSLLLCFVTSSQVGGLMHSSGRHGP
jgi:hypothetical protein